jgi:hypothetical protein
MKLQVIQISGSFNGRIIFNGVALKVTEQEQSGFENMGLNHDEAILVAIQRLFYTLKYDKLFMKRVLFIFSFFVWGETESTWYFGH